MGIESTMMVKKSDALSMLREKRIQVYENDCNERLSDMLYEHKESIFENYHVVDDDYEGDEYDNWKSNWAY